jgi:hypothetical protein
MEDDSIDVFQIDDPDKSVRDKMTTITEIMTYRFHYPFMALVKGGTEIFTYDFTKGSFGFCQLNSPIIAVTSTENVKSIISFHVLFDVGKFFVYGEIVARDTNDMALTYSKRFIEKDLLEKDKILTFFDPTSCRWNDTEEEHPGIIILTANYLQQINLVKYGSKVIKESKNKLGDIINLNGTGLIIGEKGSDEIYHLPVPIKVDDDKAYQSMYKSHDKIRSIRFNFEEEMPYIYLCDQDNFLKKFDMVRTESTSLGLINEYYTYEGFNGKNLYRINEGMLFDKDQGYKLQEKDADKIEYSNERGYYKPDLDMDVSTISEEFPLISEDVLMFAGKSMTNSNTFKQMKVVIMPSYESPLFRLLPHSLAKFLKNEFYFYPKSFHEEFIVYRLNRTDIQ